MLKQLSVKRRIIKNVLNVGVQWLFEKVNEGKIKVINFGVVPTSQNVEA